MAVPMVLFGADASAQDFDAGSEGERNWEVILGAGGFREPTFEGANRFDDTVLPVFSITYDDRYSLGVDGFAARFYDRGALGLTAKVGYDFGRAEGDDPHLAGLGDIDGGVTVGFGVDYEAGPIALFADVERSYADSNGTVAKFGAEVSGQVGNVLLGADISASWADANHMSSFFGVTAAQSASSGLAAYDASAGLKRVDLELSATYRFSESWMLGGEVEIGELLGDAAKSPIVQDKTQVAAGLFLACRF